MATGFILTSGGDGTVRDVPAFSSDDGVSLVEKAVAQIGTLTERGGLSSAIPSFEDAQLVRATVSAIRPSATGLDEPEVGVEFAPPVRECRSRDG